MYECMDVSCPHYMFIDVHTYSGSQDKLTALHYASEGGHHDTVRVLLERGADPNMCDKVSSVYIDHAYKPCLLPRGVAGVCGDDVVVSSDATKSQSFWCTLYQWRHAYFVEISLGKLGTFVKERMIGLVC